MRLLFAALVLFSHSFELVDGDRSHEPLTRLLGTLSLGEVGVAGFFLISGYLIIQSLDRSASIQSYLRKRVLRIYPAFIAAFAVCIFIVGPLAGANPFEQSNLDWLQQILHCALLDMPQLPNAFDGLHQPLLNGSMWTIPYEFRCYILIAAAGYFLLRHRAVLLALAVVLLALSPFHFEHRFAIQHFGNLADDIQLTAIFLWGAVFYAFRKEIVYRTGWAALAGIALLACLFNLTTATLAVPTLGAYFLFWLAFSPTLLWAHDVDRNVDISYGLYLYAWPVQNLLIRWVPGITALEVLAISAVVAVILGSLSWLLIEGPIKLRPQLSYRPQSY